MLLNLFVIQQNSKNKLSAFFKIKKLLQKPPQRSKLSLCTSFVWQVDVKYRQLGQYAVMLATDWPSYDRRDELTFGRRWIKQRRAPTLKKKNEMI